MVKHTKPTPEEIDAQIKKSQEELDKLDEQEDKETPEEDPQDTPDTTDEEDTQEDEGDDTPDDSAEEEDAEEDKGEEDKGEEEDKPDDKKEHDYKKRYVDSNRENQRLYHSNKKMAEAMEEAEGILPPTDDEMKAEFSDWDVMSDSEQKLARDTVLSNKRFKILSEAAKVTKNMAEWDGKVDEYITDPQTLIDVPELEGKQDDFKLYATEKGRAGTAFDILVSAFLHDQSKNKPPKKKGKMFEEGTGGSKEKIKPKSDMLTASQGRVLMKSNYKLYKEKLLAGKIANE